jgi:hypothetical protein
MTRVGLVKQLKDAGLSLGGFKGEPEDTEMRSARRVQVVRCPA